MIDLKNVCIYYESLPHQDEALEYLQMHVEDDVLEEFSKIWRNEIDVSEPRTPVSSIRKKEGGVYGADPLAEKIVNFYFNKGWRIKTPQRNGQYQVLICGLEGAHPNGQYNISLNNDDHRLDNWNDTIVLLKVDYDNSVRTFGAFLGTTEPSIYWTTSNRANRGGAARVQINHLNKDIWVVGMHLGREEALCQWGKPISITRDSNKDFKRTGDKITTGHYGINFHSGGNSHKIGRWSAGCQVIKNVSEFRNCMSWIKNAEGYKYNKKFLHDYGVIDAKLL